ncbi:uncharacterized protein LOC118750510 [Rhagoletis pomonella]|uniref:uncharacterized protein LOC118750510 n=1 Tax=Rhagoletis pomonella TaxID=28610 RepID=UPI0017863C73|nr:uncharacterized protein LOC118750510 [Rhagoletis pomonella]
MDAEIIPYEVHMQRYKEIKAKIFNNPVESPVVKSRSTNRMKTFWKNIKLQRRNIGCIISSIQNKGADLRPYAQISFLDRTILALLDSGAQVSCIGSTLAKEVSNSKKLKQHRTVCTAAGRKQIVFGMITLAVPYKEKIKAINFFVIPCMSQDVILGIYFWSKFQIAPHIISQIDSGDFIDENQLRLSCDQQQQLNLIKSRFPNCEKEGLGKTSLIEHEIELEPNVRPVKQHYFPISPAN